MVVYIKIGKLYLFDGPYETPMEVPETSGIYLVLCYRESEDNPEVLYVDAVTNPRGALSKHPKEECWKKNCDGTIKYAFRPIEKFKLEKREDYIEEIIFEHNPICNKPPET